MKISFTENKLKSRKNPKIIEFGGVSVGIDRILITGFTFEDCSLLSQGAELALEWAIDNLEIALEEQREINAKG